MSNYRKEILDAGLRMLKEGITIGTWGNISRRDPRSGHIFITPSGMPYDTLTEADILELTPDGTIVEGFRKPSIETEMHLAVYRQRPDCHAIVHTHAVYSTAFAAMGEDIPLFLDEAAQYLGDTVHTTAYALPGTTTLAEECVKALGAKGMACLLRSHGAVCLGENLDKAFVVSSVLEATARVYSIIRSMGGQYDPISPENIAYMQDFAKNRYGQK